MSKSFEYRLRGLAEAVGVKMIKIFEEPTQAEKKEDAFNLCGFCIYSVDLCVKINKPKVLDIQLLPVK